MRREREMNGISWNTRPSHCIWLASQPCYVRTVHRVSISYPW